LERNKKEALRNSKVPAQQLYDITTSNKKQKMKGTKRGKIPNFQVESSRSNGVSVIETVKRLKLFYF
jgi:hypothetical protein